MTTQLIWAAAGTGFTALMTILGSGVVFLFRHPSSHVLHRTLLGFAAGVMIAASMWSLLIPAIEQTEAVGFPGWIPAAGGSALGILFLLSMDYLLPCLEKRGLPDTNVNLPYRRTALFILAVTLHNIPEGIAVAVSCANAASQHQAAQITAAMALSFGIGIQNFPEGAAISLPLYQDGMSRPRAFFTGSLSGIVEPVFGLLTVFLVGSIQSLMPWLLSFAAGAMLYVVVEELIPEINPVKGDHSGTLGVMIGFLLMMILDVALG